MKVNYRGFEIDVRRDESMGGDKMYYWSVFRSSDGMEMHSGCDYEESIGVDSNVRSEILNWKIRVDEFLELPVEEQIAKDF
jgi:hypothetical protein